MTLDKTEYERLPEPEQVASGIVGLCSTIDDAQDERPVQQYLIDHGYLFTPIMPPGDGLACFDRPRFGSEFIPDFLISTRTSIGVQWVMVELESPCKKPLTKSGRPSAHLNEALGQVRDWRSWLRTNIAYAQSELGLEGLDAECEAYVLIGRRSSISRKHVRRFRELSEGHTYVMTYDRLVDAVRRQLPIGSGG